MTSILVTSMSQYRVRLILSCLCCAIEQNNCEYDYVMKDVSITGLETNSIVNLTATMIEKRRCHVFINYNFNITSDS